MMKEHKECKEYQVTLLCATHQYKPVSTIVKADTTKLALIGKQAYLKDIKQRGIQAICNKRYWTGKDLIRYNYTLCKVREYDKKKIEREKKERYKKILDKE